MLRISSEHCFDSSAVWTSFTNMWQSNQYSRFSFTYIFLIYINFMLLRQFIHDRLYHPRAAYFTKPAHQVGRLSTPLPFHNMIGKADFLQHLQRQYPQEKWLTPSEIFKPFYGFTLGRVMQKLFKERKGGRVNIVEIGPGQGSAAKSIIQYFRSSQLNLLQNLNYYCVQISQGLSEALSRQFRSQGLSVQVLNHDFLDCPLRLSKDDLTFVLMLQVLDNLPHDKVIVKKQSCLQTRVKIKSQGEYQNLQQSQQPLEDPLIKRVLQTYQNAQDLTPLRSQSFFQDVHMHFLRKIYRPTSNNIFLPTYFQMFLDKIKNEMPTACLIVSDFDELFNRFTKSAGINAPLVKRRTKDPKGEVLFKDYLIRRGEADILFPSNFKLLKEMHDKSLNRKCRILKSESFMKEFGQPQWCRTRNGYNPLLSYFANTSFLLGRPA